MRRCAQCFNVLDGFTRRFVVAAFGCCCANSKPTALLHAWICRWPAWNITAAQYFRFGLRWFEYYDATATAVEGSTTLSKR